ncbi:hypothetical protein [Nitrosotalea sinensis]|uniref:hypothetical protein n=1 Tax=Nitrosotalea sinensis TaxID=1499975 RepID=UPI000C30F77A|nr:hypothetical protein [Candidatus Nitrosotalea sinensis]
MDNALDSIEQLVKENKWLEQFFEGQGCCIWCFHSDPFDLEDNHVGGKVNSDFTLSMCRNCHGKFSRKQYGWPKGWSRKNKSERQKTACLLIGLGDIIRGMGERMYHE